MRHPQTLKCVQIPSATDSLFFLPPIFPIILLKVPNLNNGAFCWLQHQPKLERKERKNMKEDKTRADWVTWKQHKTHEKQQNWNCPPTHHANGALLSLLLLFSALSHTHTHSLSLSLSLSLSKYKDLTAILTNPIQAKFLSLPKYNNLTAILTNPIQGKTSNHTRVQILQTGNGEFSMKTWDRIPCPTSLTLVPSTLVGRYKGSSVLNVCGMSTVQRWKIHIFWAWTLYIGEGLGYRAFWILGPVPRPVLAILGPLRVPKIQRKELNDVLWDEKGLS